MLPKNASREAPSIHLLQSILQRANVTMEVVGLASCILDCLSAQFVRRWRQEYCAVEGSAERCEILAVAALCIALKFLEDTVCFPQSMRNEYFQNIWMVHRADMRTVVILQDVGS